LLSGPTTRCASAYCETESSGSGVAWHDYAAEFERLAAEIHVVGRQLFDIFLEKWDEKGGDAPRAAVADNPAKGCLIGAINS
jgi:hypothetical protein